MLGRFIKTASDISIPTELLEELYALYTLLNKDIEIMLAKNYIIELSGKYIAGKINAAGIEELVKLINSNINAIVNDIVYIENNINSISAEKINEIKINEKEYKKVIIAIHTAVSNIKEDKRSEKDGADKLKSIVDHFYMKHEKLELKELHKAWQEYIVKNDMSDEFAQIGWQLLVRQKAANYGISITASTKTHKPEKVMRMVRPGVRTTDVGTPGTYESGGMSGFSLDYSALSRGGTDMSNSVTDFSGMNPNSIGYTGYAADDGYHADDEELDKKAGLPLSFDNITNEIYDQVSEAPDAVMTQKFDTFCPQSPVAYADDKKKKKKPVKEIPIVRKPDAWSIAGKSYIDDGNLGQDILNILGYSMKGARVTWLKERAEDGSDFIVHIDDPSLVLKTIEENEPDSSVRPYFEPESNIYEADDKVFYHGSPNKFDMLDKGSWITPYKEDAIVFGVPWSSDDLLDAGDDETGRPPKKLNFKAHKIPDDQPIYLYEIDSNDVKPASTNTGKDYDWNYKTTKELPVKLIKTINSWQKELLDDDTIEVVEKTASPDYMEYNTSPNLFERNGDGWEVMNNDEPIYDPYEAPKVENSVDDKNSIMPKRNLKSIETTAGELCLILYGEPIDAMNAGNYKGTSIPMRKIPSNAPVTLVSWSGGGCVKSNEQWIADRFGGLGHREALKAFNALTELYQENKENEVDDKLKVKMRKAKDFAETGTWLVETPQGIKKMFSDVYNTRWWHEDTGKPETRHNENFLGFNKTEAIEKLLEKYPPIKINETDDKKHKTFIGNSNGSDNLINTFLEIYNYNTYGIKIKKVEPDEDGNDIIITITNPKAVLETAKEYAGETAIEDVITYLDLPIENNAKDTIEYTEELPAFWSRNNDYKEHNE